MIIREPAEQLRDFVKKLSSDNPLVVFAGAGISKPPPSNLPLFDKLAENVGRHFGMRPEQGENIDAFFGKLCLNNNREARKQVIEEIVRIEPKPNHRHKHLLKLFESPLDVRLITTNFDLLFRDQLENICWGKDLFHHKTIPENPDKFKGMFNIHGTIEGDPDNMILTAKDFAREYFRNSGKSNLKDFLYTVFGHFSILFVGYGLNDPIMKYIFQAMPPNRNVLALCPTKEIQKWTSANISVLQFHVTEGGLGYSKLDFILQHLPHLFKSARNKELLDEGILRKIVNLKEPESILQDETHLESILSKKDRDEEDFVFVRSALSQLSRVRLFVRRAKTEKWMEWLVSEKILDPLLDTIGQPDPERHILSKWIATGYAAKPNDFLRNTGTGNQGFHPILWHDILWQLTHGKPRPEPEVLGKWLSILLNHVPSDAKFSNSLDYLLSKMRYPDDLDSALVLLNYQLSPMTETDNFDYTPRVTLRGDDYWLKESWKNYFLPHLDKGNCSRRVIAIAEANLLTAHQLARSTGNADENYDPASRWRSAIEPHSQDDTGGKLDPLIDTARDALGHVLAQNPVEGKAVVERWILHKAPLLQRIAIYGVGISNNYTPDEKLQWLLDKELIYKYKHEVFQVLKAGFAPASTELQNKIISIAKHGPSLSEDIENRHEISKYEAYNLLFWLHKNAPKHQQAKEAFDTIQSINPNFKTREFADFDMWIGSAELVREISPRKPEELSQMSPDATIQLFSSLKEKETFREERSKRGMAEAIGAAVTQSFDWSSRLVDTALKSEVKDHWFWYNIAHAWLSMELTDDNWHWILTMLKDNNAIHGISSEIPNLIDAGAKDKRISPILLPVAEEAADAIWESLKDEKLKYEHDQDWLMTAMNEPVGRVVEAWIQLLGRHIMDKPEDWKGMSGDYKHRFKEALGHEAVAGNLARATIMSRFHWFFSVDMDWARTVLLPYFDFDRNPQHAEQSWHGFLYWGRIYPAVRPLMKKYLAQAVEHLPNTQRDIRDQLFHHVVDILLGDAGNPLKDGWFYDILKSKSITAENRREMARRIWHTLRDADDTFKYSIWDRWLNKYWKDRTDNIPIKLTNEEATEFLNWAPVMSENFPEAVDRICEFKSFPIKYTFLFSDLKDDKLDERFPEDLLRMLVHVLNDGNNTTLHCHDLVPLYETLKEKLGDEQTLKLKALLMEKGCIS